MHNVYIYATLFVDTMITLINWLNVDNNVCIEWFRQKSFKLGQTEWNIILLSWAMFQRFKFFIVHIVTVFFFACK